MLRCAVRTFSHSLLLGLVCLSLGATTAAAYPIDTFEDPDDTQVGPVSGAHDPATGVLGGRREFEVTNANGTMDIDTTFDRLLFSTTGASTLILTYPDLGSLDIDVANGGFELDVFSISNPATFSISVLLEDNTPTSESDPFVFPALFTAPDTLRLDLSEFTNVDLTDIEVITLTIAASGPGSIKITDFRVVPEPSTAACLGLGLLGLAASGRRRALTRLRA